MAKSKDNTVKISEYESLEKTLWATADKLRNNMDAAEYKHIVLGLIFLKYISDSFEELYNKLKSDHLSDPEDKDEYLAENVFYVPPSARWNYLQHQRAKLPTIGKDIDDAMDAIEKDNPSLKGVLPKDYARPALDKKRLGELVDLIGNVGFNQKGHSSKDLLGRVYEYFLGMFADAEGKRGGQFYTPESIVKLLVEMLEPYSGRIYDGCCGSGGMFVQSEKFLEAHGGKIKDIAVYGQESNPTTYKLAKMNLAIQGFCKSATISEVEANNYVLTPGRYVGTEEVEDDGISYDQKVATITENLKVYFEQSIELQERIKANLVKIGINI